MESDFPLLSLTVLSTQGKKKKKQIHKKHASRKRMRLETLPSSQVVKVTHASSKSCMPSVQPPAPVSRRSPAHSIYDSKESIQKCVESKRQMLADKNVITRGAVLGMLKESTAHQDFFVRVIREEADGGVVFEVKDFVKFVVVVMTAIDELCINVEKKGQDLKKILQFLQVDANMLLVSFHTKC